MASRSRRSTILSIAATALSVALTVSACSSPHTRRTSPPTQGAAPPSGTAAPTTSQAASVPTGWSLIATTHGAIPSYNAPGDPADGAIPATWHGGVSALPVIAQRPGWLQVRLATRPNQSTAWVRQSDVTLTATPYRIVVNLTARHLELIDGGKIVLDAPAGIGTPPDPTPTGQYFVALFAQPPSPGYGPFVIVTSAHSNTITDWEQSGDALIAIHGPLDADSQIGTTGAPISHGCIRLHVSDQQQLRQIPAGSPITITD